MNKIKNYKITKCSNNVHYRPHQPTTIYHVRGRVPGIDMVMGMTNGGGGEGKMLNSF